jgi:N-acetylglucosamine-6-phosphate deacetylase
VNPRSPAPTRLRGTVLTPEGFVRGELVLDGARVAAVHGEPVGAADRPGAAALAAGGALLLPGFVDTHLHGGGGADVMDGGDALATIARTHARHGTTAFLATTMTAPPDEVRAALHAIAPHVARRSPGGARVLGVHLEGPFLSPRRLGAQPPFTHAATLGEVLALHAIAPIRLLTLAPEEPGHLALIPALVAHGIRVQLGHSEADYDTGVAALQAGASGFTHLFNAMSALHHRAPGMVGAALAHAGRAELIPDLLHVHPGAMLAARRAIPGLFAVTDATAAAGMPDGEYRLGRHRVHKCAGGVRLADGTLAGSALTLDQALRNLAGIGIPLAEAAAMVATRPADHLGLTDRGRLAPGAWADVVVLDADLAVRGVFVEGEALGLADA